MRRIKDVKKVLHAIAFLIVVSKHEGKCDDHKPLYGPFTC